MTTTTITDLKIQRASAGSVYAAAAQAYLDAYAELKAFDMALGNAAFSQVEPPSFGGGVPIPVPHGEFLRDSIHGGLSDRIQARHLQLIASVNA